MATISSVVKFFPVAQEGFVTTTSGSTASGAATVGLNSVTGYTNGDTVCLVIEPTSATNKQVFTGVVDTSGVQITGVKWTEGTNVIHNAGSTVADYVTATHMSIVTKGLLIEHNVDGTHGNITLSDTNYIKDSNGNELLKVSKTTSAVNEVTVKNAATTTFPSFRATGGDTNLDLLLGGKGTGSARFSGVYDGWNDAFETLTYGSATTFTCSTALAAKLQAGDKIKLTQTTVKYFYVVSVASTTVTVTGGTDFTLANAAITLPFYSHESTPSGFPDYFAFTPSWTNLTPGSGTNQGNFSMIGKTVRVKTNFVFGSGSAVGTVPTLTLPITSAAVVYSAASIPQLGVGTLLDAGNTVYPALINWGSTTTAFVRDINAGGTIAVHADLSSTAPFTWGTSDAIYTDFSYQAA